MTNQPDEGKGEYKVGYKRPPKDKQFKKDEPSPNPKGRPKKINSITDILPGLYKRKVTINGPNGPERVALVESVAMRLTTEGTKTGKDAQRCILTLLKLEEHLNIKQKVQQDQYPGGILAVRDVLPLDEWIKEADAYRLPDSEPIVNDQDLDNESE